MEFFEFLKTLTDPQSIIQYGGFLLVLLVVFAESGVAVAFWLPGDSLLFISGLLANPRVSAEGAVIPYPLYIVLICLFVASFLGYLFGYYFGFSTGKSLLKKKESIFFKVKYVAMARLFFRKYGGKTLVISRFLPVIRTFSPILAGMVKMNIRQFLAFNIIGGIFWVFSLVIIGYVVAEYFPDPQRYLKYIVIGLVVSTAIPIVKPFLKKRPAAVGKRK